MDKITESLLRYLDAAEIPYDTREGATESDYTETFIHIEDEEEENSVDLTISVFPEDGNFFFKAQPRYVFYGEHLKQIRAVENKWNRTGQLTSMIVKEETGVIKPDAYTFTITTRGICDLSGQSEYVWSEYLSKTLNQTWQAWGYIDSIINNCD